MARGRTKAKTRVSTPVVAASTSLRQDVREEITAIRQASAEVARTPKTALLFLKKIGILNRQGRLARSYR